jgi:hypothetical protein
MNPVGPQDYATASRVTAVPEGVLGGGADSKMILVPERVAELYRRLTLAKC